MLEYIAALPFLRALTHHRPRKIGIRLRHHIADLLATPAKGWGIWLIRSHQSESPFRQVIRNAAMS